MRIRPATPADAAAIAAIYRPYVTDTAVSFELDPPDTEEMRRRVEAGGELYPWLLAEESEAIGYASAGPFRARPAYRFTVETSIYLAPQAVGRGVGRQLYARLLSLLEAQGFAQAIGAITLPNPASAGLHERLGFERAGTYGRVGWKFGAWHSVGLWQRPLAPLDSRPAEPKPFRQVWSGG